MSGGPQPPEGLCRTLAHIEGEGVLLIRHSDREPLPPGDAGVDVPLTLVGKQRAGALRERLRHLPQWALSSPTRRCRNTAVLLGSSTVDSSVLGMPGAFVEAPEQAGPAFAREGTEGVVRGMLRGITWPGMRSLKDGVQRLDAALRARCGTGFGLAVSHDAIVLPYIAYHTGYDFFDDWLAPLDGVFITQHSVVWRGQSFPRKP